MARQPEAIRPPSCLLEVQRWLAGLILRERPLDESEANAATGRLRLEDPRLARARLAAYVGGYPARIEESLADAYPAVRHILGAAEFHRLAADYMPMVPAGTYNLNAVGYRLPELLRQHRLNGELPFLADLAALEWAVWKAFHAGPGQPFDPARLAGWSAADFERAAVRLQPGVAVVCSEWPIADLWAARSTPRDQIDIVLAGRPQNVLVYRCGLEVACETLGRLEAEALSALAAGRTLGEVARRLAAAGADPADVGAWFGGWSARGLVADCDCARGASPGT
ncbi:MAG: DUF2063 domain-containing protein [Candidatus Dadabacteria bacterium]|nr:MAG: DUF2063 domain-containing protein [Candidatus Dadabacteria bacterium]